MRRAFINHLIISDLQSGERLSPNFNPEFLTILFITTKI